MVGCQEIKQAIEASMPKIFKCSENGKFLELSTPFLYPDGDVVNIFIKTEEKRIVITDAGETFRNLLMYNITTQLTKTRENILNDVLEVYKVNNVQGELWLEVKDTEQIAMGLMRLGQTITRLMDLTYTVRHIPKTNFNNKVSEFLIKNQIECERDYRIVGGSGEEHKIDFLVKTNRRKKLIKTLSSKDASSANALVSKTFRSWYDISRVDNSQKLTLLDDENDFWKDEWKAQLTYFSKVINFSDKDGIIEFLRTA